MPTSMLIWYIFLCSVSVINIIALILFWRKYHNNKISNNQNQQVQFILLILATIFVLGCASRSVFPKADVQRIVFYDTFWTSILVGRTVATIAELAFVAQWAIVLNKLAYNSKLNFSYKFSYAIVPLIIVAEVFSWMGVLTTNNLWHFIEESIWGSIEVVLTVSAIIMWRRYRGVTKKFVGGMAIGGAIYVLYMFTLDIPMYFTRWLEEVSNHTAYTTFAEGFKNLATDWHVTRNPSDWTGEFIWMIIYFSLAVWISLAFTQTPFNRLKSDYKGKH